MGVKGMGLTHVKVKVHGRDGSTEVQLLVDTGSIFTWLSSDRLNKLGVEPTGTRRFRTIEGREVNRRVGEAVLELIGERATQIVVFAEAEDAEVLGAYSLEGLGLEVDPTTKQLRKVGAFIAY